MTMTLHRLEIESGTVHDLSTIADFVDEVGVQCTVQEHLLYHVKMAVDEACANIFEHAYAGGPGRVKIEIECASTQLIVRIQDWGTPFDPTAYQVPDPSLSLEERPIGGLGLHFIHTLMDEVEYHFDPHAGNCLTLRKNLNAQKG